MLIQKGEREMRDLRLKTADKLSVGGAHSKIKSYCKELGIDTDRPKSSRVEAHWNRLHNLGKPSIAIGAAAVVMTLTALAANPVAASENEFEFDMVRSPALAKFPDCVPNAKAHVKIIPRGPVEVMRVEAEGLPPNANFDFFVIQAPNAPFGLAWYQGDLETHDHGGRQNFIGRFNEETFIVAPGPVPAPLVHNKDFPDVNTNPVTGPVHTFHLGLWFNSPQDAINAGCPGTVTPFNGEHNAGVQVLNTSNFPDNGPLFNVKP
jgi:hypothetical protein